MTPFQEALLAIEIAVDALNKEGTESARDALEQIRHLGFDTRPGEERKKQPEKPRAIRRSIQPSLFPE